MEVDEIFDGELDGQIRIRVLELFFEILLYVGIRPVPAEGEKDQQSQELALRLAELVQARADSPGRVPERESCDEGAWRGACESRTGP